MEKEKLAKVLDQHQGQVAALSQQVANLVRTLDDRERQLAELESTRKDLEALLVQRHSAIARRDEQLATSQAKALPSEQVFPPSLSQTLFL